LQHIQKVPIKKNIPYVLITLGPDWNYTKLGNSYFLFNYSGDAHHLPASFQTQLVFHYFPQTGRYILPAANVSLFKYVPYYFSEWQTYYHYHLLPSFNGFTTEKNSTLKCSYSQGVIAPSSQSAESYAYLGFPLIDPSSEIVVVHGTKFINVNKFAVGQVYVTLPRRKDSITPNKQHTAEIIGTYCISPSIFVPFA